MVKSCVYKTQDFFLILHLIELCTALLAPHHQRKRYILLHFLRLQCAISLKSEA